MELLLTESIRPDERILFLGLPDAAIVAAVSRVASAGEVVVMGHGEVVCEGRRAFRDLDNVMVTPGSPDELPWRDGFFTRVIDTVRDWPDAAKVRREVERVTAHG